MKLSPLQIMWHANDDHGRLLIHITSWNELVTIEWAFKNGLIINWSNNSWFVAHGSRLMTKGKGMGATKKLAGWLLEAGGGDEHWRWRGAMANRRRWCGGDGKRRSGMIGALGKRRAGERRGGGPFWSSAPDLCVQNILQHFGTYTIEVNRDK